MKNPYFVDLHCDTLLRSRLDGFGLADAPGHVSLDLLRDSGSLLQCFAAFIPMGEHAAYYGIRQTPWEFFHILSAVFREEMQKNAAFIRPARSMADVAENLEAGRISAMLTLEDGACVEGRLERVGQLYDAGVRLVTLTWNFENCIGFPNSPDPALHAKGLKPFGFEVLEEMGRLGMVVDVSHLSEGGFWDVARENKKPFVASHSCARALCDHPRNLTDAQLHALGDAGGVCGVNFYSRFLKEGAAHTENEDILRHIDYIAAHAGLEAVALGSDFDGIDCTLEMVNYGGLVRLAEQIADRFGADAADKICRDNALRVFTDVIG